jgi:Copper type II ascorbate-dependent monooxygenase, C-terminal domain
MPLTPTMRLPSLVLLVLVATVLVLGCSSSSGGSGQPQASDLTLTSTPVTVSAGQESYLCWSFAVPAGAPLNVVQTLPTMPKGIHHFAVFTSPDPLPAAASGYDCHEMGLDWGLVNAGGIGTPGMTFPDGTALGLQPGSQVILQLHILNASPTDLDIGATSVQLVAGTASSYQAIGLLIAGTLDITIPPNDPAATVNGGCPAPIAMSNVFAVFPHMHQLGTHLHVGVVPTGATSETLVYDASWNFGTQGVYPVATSIDTGDAVNVVCTYDNTTDNTVSFGLSSTDEMCFGVLYYYPAANPTQASTYCGFGAGNGP